MNFKKIMAASVASVMAVSAMAVAASAHTAGLIFQTGTYGFRNTIAQSSAVWWDEFDEANPYADWSVNDVSFTTDGTYTVSFTTDDEDGASNWNFLKLQTDIASADYPDVQITIDSLKVDGAEIAAAKSAVQGTDKTDGKDSYADGYNSITTAIVDAYLVGLFNTYNAEETFISGTDFGHNVELTFTITGLGSADNGNAGDGTAADNNTVGDTTTNTGNDKTSADTGVEGVAVVAGIAVLAAGAIVVAKKRK